jgi:hypothetical protein
MKITLPFLLVVELWDSNNGFYTLPECDQIFYCLPKWVEYFLKAIRTLNTIVLLPVALHGNEMFMVYENIMLSKILDLTGRRFVKTTYGGASQFVLFTAYYQITHVETGDARRM